MKQTITIFSIAFGMSAFSQGFVNGSFESTTSTGCDYNNTIPSFNSKMDNVVMFSGGEIDIVQSGCYVPSIPEGIKAIALADDPAAIEGTDAVNMELTTPLISGADYNLTFSTFSNNARPLGMVQIGCTEDSAVLGALVDSVTPAVEAWTEHTITFTAPNNATHISVRNEQDEIHWNFIDNFSIELACTPLTIEVSEEALCDGEELTLTATGTGSIEWSDGILNGEPFVPSSTGTLTYTVNSDADDDCPGSVEVEVFELPTVTATTTAEEICVGDSITLSGEGAVEYEWDAAEVEDSVAFIPTESALFTVTGLDENGCENEGSIMITVNELPAVEATVSDDEICEGESVVFTGTGATTYTWDSGVVDGGSVSPTATATYTVTGTDDNGCVNTDEVEVTVYDALEITYSTTDELFGADGEINITVAGGNPTYTFDWDNDGTGDFDDSEDLTGLVGGTYNLVVEDAAGCTATQEVILGTQLSVEEEALFIAVYPNPTTDQLFIALNGNFNYTLYTLNGDLLMNGVATNNAKIDMNNFAAGVYFISVNAENTSKTIKVVKQ